MMSYHMTDITKQAHFGEFSFYVDERVIIPRSLLAEILVDNKLEPFLQNTDVRHCLDLCTGSGCLAIMLAHAFPDASIDATGILLRVYILTLFDISKEALEVAAINVNHYQLKEQINLVQSDMFDKLKGRTYDLIICNPPYVTEENMNTLPEEFKHEPKIALAGGQDGLDFVRKILKEAHQCIHIILCRFIRIDLKPKGLLVVEAGEKQRTKVEKTFPAYNFGWISTNVGDDDVFFLRDHYGKKEEQ